METIFVCALLISEYLGKLAISQVKGLYLDPKPHHERLTDAETQQCGVTKQSLSSIPSIKFPGHFGNVFVKPSTVFVILKLIFTLFYARLRKEICA